MNLIETYLFNKKNQFLYWIDLTWPLWPLIFVWTCVNACDKYDVWMGTPWEDYGLFFIIWDLWCLSMSDKIRNLILFATLGCFLFNVIFSFCHSFFCVDLFFNGIDLCLYFVATYALCWFMLTYVRLCYYFNLILREFTWAAYALCWFMWPDLYMFNYATVLSWFYMNSVDFICFMLIHVDLCSIMLLF